MADYLIRFKVIDHESDICSPIEQTIIPASNRKEALDILYEGLDYCSVYLESINEIYY